jgi:hypothetical protein
MGYDLGSNPPVAYRYQLRCAVCRTLAKSETIVSESFPKISDLRRTAEEDAFTANLKRRGWDVGRHICRDCRIAIHLQTAEDLLPPKGGETNAG